MTPNGTRGDAAPYGCSTGGAQQRADVGIGPYEKERATSTTRASGAEWSVCASGCEEMGENRGRDHPQSTQQPRTIPQSRLRRASSLYTREPWGRGFGPPRSSAPTDATLVAQAAGHAEGTESPSNHPSQRRRAKRLRQRSQGIGKNRSSGRRKGVLRDYRGSALSAEREAGQIQVLPDDLGVQHGVRGSEVSARPRPCSRRGCVD